MMEENMESRDGIVPETGSPARTLQTALQAVIEREGMSVREASVQVDVGYSTLSAWLNGTYNGRTDKIDEKVSRWLDANRTRSKVRQHASKPPAFLDLPTSAQLITVMEYAQFTPDMGLITGGAGIGKTEAGLEYQRRNPNVWILTADPSMQTPASVLRELCDVLDIPHGSAQRRMAAVIRRVQGTGGLIIIDEAQHLKTDAIDTLRTIHDRTQTGVVFIGNEPLRRRIEGMSREASHAMIFSRIGMRKKRDRPQVKDVGLMLDAWQITERKLRDLLRFIAMKPGGLRQMNKTISYAQMLMRADGRTDLTDDDINAAWRELTSGELPSAV